MSFSAADTARLPTTTTLGTVRLTVADLDRSLRFYEQVLGMRPIPQDDGTLGLGAGSDGVGQRGGAAGAGAAGDDPGDARPLLLLHGDAAAPPVNPRLTGLFHFAVLVPTRRDLAVSLVRLAQSRWPLSGASDHLVSEALYLNDPDGNGIEIYRDRPRGEWPSDGDGHLRMATLPLDLDDVAGELTGDPPDPARDSQLAPGTRIGHVHLQVSELDRIEAFYHDLLGFDVMVRAYPGAVFVAAGGYHHHIGLNTWNSRAAGPPPPNAAGLHSFEVLLPGSAVLQDVVARIESAGLPTEAAPEGTLVRDPSGNGVLLTC